MGVVVMGVVVTGCPKKNHYDSQLPKSPPKTNHCLHDDCGWPGQAHGGFRAASKIQVRSKQGVYRMKTHSISLAILTSLEALETFPIQQLPLQSPPSSSGSLDKPWHEYYKYLFILKEMGFKQIHWVKD